MIAENGLPDVHGRFQPAAKEVMDQVVTSRDTAIEVTVLTRVSEAHYAWQQLKEAALDNPYQAEEWIEAWHKTLGKEHNAQAAIVVGSIKGKVALVLPLALQRMAGIKTLSFLGYRNSNQNTGFWDASFYSHASTEQVRSVLVAACKKLGADLVSLHNVPEIWHGRMHPLVLAASTQSPSPIFTRALPDDFDALFKDTHNKSARKNLLRKQRHLQAVEGYRVVKAVEPGDISRGFKAFLEQRAARAAQAGIPNVFSKPAAQEFLSRLLGLEENRVAASKPAMDIWFLEAGGVIRSTYLCIERSGTIYAYSNSVAHDDMLPNSPGLVLIKEIINHACLAPELVSLDLGLGEERYKTAWAQPVELRDSLLPITWKGNLKRHLDLSITTFKTAIRNSETLWRLVRRLRKWKAG